VARGLGAGVRHGVPTAARGAFILGGRRGVSNTAKCQPRRVGGGPRTLTVQFPTLGLRLARGRGPARRDLHAMQPLRLLQLVERGLQLGGPHRLARPLVHQLVQVVREGACLVVAVVCLGLDVQGGLGARLGAGDQAAGGGPTAVLFA